VKIGVLAVQGAFAEHEQALNALGVQHFQIRQKRDLNQPFHGLILPGGESTAMIKLLHDLDLYKALESRISCGFPVFGTCAGMILLARKLSNDDRTCFRSMDITVKRNAYGRQLGSFAGRWEFQGLGRIPMVFIRAPYIEEASSDVQVLAVVDGCIVAARQGNQLAVAFHPELTDDPSVHRYFLEIVQGAQGKR